MARFDVFRNRGGQGFLLDVQSDLLEGLNTRVVVPLMPRESAPVPAQRLNPVFEIDRTAVVMVTQFMAAIPAAELNEVVCSLEAARDDVTVALDFLFVGF